jgi:Na+/proline symporter/nitrogen-specific signal transduction histidine kinase
MLSTETVIFVSICYVGLLFAVAYYGDKRADAGRSIINSPYVYALSMAVFCTAWTFYGSVGRAVHSGPAFLAIYIGPTLMTTIGWLVMRKILRISRVHRITSIADFIASRYGKSILLGGVVTIIAVLGIVPYISLQLKAVSISFQIMTGHHPAYLIRNIHSIPFFQDTAFYAAFLLAVFAILFGTRKPEATERHEGIVAAIALESLVKLVAFLLAGGFVTYALYGGFSDLFTRALSNPKLSSLLVFRQNGTSFIDWSIYSFLSGLAFVLLPRQFQVAVVENVDEAHLKKAIWLFPLYMLAINIFVIPVAFAGMLHFSGQAVDPDTFLLKLPLANHQTALAMLVFIGGISATTGMVIVETIAMSTMICNNLIMPLLLHIPSLRLASRTDVSSWLIAIRHAATVLVILLGYIYYHLTAQFYTLVAIGLVSFAAVAQFAPALLGGIFWKSGTQKGALWSLVVGAMVWGYTLVLPSLAAAGILPHEFIEEGPWGLHWLKPFALFGLQGWDRVSNAVFWSLLANTATYVTISLFNQPSALEHTQAAMFVDVFRFSEQTREESLMWRGTALIPDLTSLLERFLGKERTEEALGQYAIIHNIDWSRSHKADPGFVTHVEKLLAGAIGSASARVMVASVVKEEPLGLHEVMNILDETRQVIIYSQELEKVTAGLKTANEQLKQLDRLKDEFISTVSHELRSPLTSIQSLAEILRDYPGTSHMEQKNFLDIMIKEIHRLSRLINQVLDFQKIETGKMQWHVEPVDLIQVIKEAGDAMHQLVSEKQLHLFLELPPSVPMLAGDRDQLIQALINLISNAVKFCEPRTGRIHVSLSHDAQTAPQELNISVRDNGIGIRPADHKTIFEQFRQITPAIDRGRPQGSGLGLAITKRIIDCHKGRIWVDSELGCGATFNISLPVPLAGKPFQAG